MPRTRPTGSYDTPSTSYSRSVGSALPPPAPAPAPAGLRLSAMTSEVTVIWLVVSVPVLSVQMTVVHPSVSTDGSLRTTTLRAAMRRVPSERQSVMTAGRPSGMAATPRATATLR